MLRDPYPTLPLKVNNGMKIGGSRSIRDRPPVHCNGIVRKPGQPVSNNYGLYTAFTHLDSKFK
jgi:hypothetical protein